MALSAPAPRISDEDPSLDYYPVAASAVCYHGGIAVLNASGYVQPGTSAASLNAVGIFDFSGDVMSGTVDNSGGANAAVNARVRKGLAWCFANKSTDLVVQADVGQFCYIYDDATVCHTGSGRSVAGIVRRIDSAGVWVQIGFAFGTALAAEIATRQSWAPATGDTGAQVATATAGNTVGAIPVEHIITVADGSTPLDALTLDATYGKLVVTNVRAIKTGTTGTSTDAVQLCTDSGGTTAVSSSLSMVIAAGVIASTTSIANNTFAAGAHLYVKRTHTTDCGCTLLVTGYRAA